MGIAKPDQSQTHTQAAVLLLLSLLLAASNKMVLDAPICPIHLGLMPPAFLLTADGLRYGFIFRPLAEPSTAQEEGDPLSRVTFTCLIKHRCTQTHIYSGVEVGAISISH